MLGSMAVSVVNLARCTGMMGGAKNMFQRILVPLDGSRQAEHVLPIAAQLARSSGGTLILLRVVNTALARHPLTSSPPKDVQRARSSHVVAAQEYLRSLIISPLLQDR